jgi:branched-chain amino acid transport system permease protein
MLSPEILITILIYGGTLGGVLALLSSGFTMIFGVVRILNMAHGAFFAMGAYIAYTIVASLGTAPVFATALAAVLVGAIGAAVYRALLAHIKGLEATVIIVTLALALILEQLLLIRFGEHGLNLSPIVAGVVEIFTIPISAIRVLALAVSMVTLALLAVFISRTRTGKEIVAASQNLEGAVIIGLHIEKLFLLSVFVSSVLAGLGGALYAQVYGVNPFLVLRVLVLAFAIVIFGGLGSLKGSVVASFIMGYIIILVTMLLGARWSEMVALMTIIAALVIRPNGLFGVRD